MEVNENTGEDSVAIPAIEASGDIVVATGVASRGDSGSLLLRAGSSSNEPGFISLLSRNGVTGDSVSIVAGGGQDSGRSAEVLGSAMIPTHIEHYAGGAPYPLSFFLSPFSYQDTLEEGVAAHMKSISDISLLETPVPRTALKTIQIVQPDPSFEFGFGFVFSSLDVLLKSGNFEFISRT